MSPIRTKPFSFPRRALIAALSLTLTLGIAAYVIFQARFLIEGPRLSLQNDLDIVQHERQITLEGRAKNITAITVNGRDIVTSETGEFAESIVLENGYTVVRIEARDRYGRTTALERSFVYVPTGTSVSLVQ